MANSPHQGDKRCIIIDDQHYMVDNLNLRKILNLRLSLTAVGLLESNRPDGESNVRVHVHLCDVSSPHHKVELQRGTLPRTRSRTKQLKDGAGATTSYAERKPRRSTSQE